jgi:amino acid adenylation domain-containing protein
MTRTDPAREPGRRADTVHGLFRWCVERWPSAIALRHNGREVSYLELDALSDSYAVELATLGVGPGHVVPVLMPRTPEFIAVLLAVLKRGAAYAALDSRWPRARLHDMIDALHAPVVVAAEDTGSSRPRWRPMNIPGDRRSPTPVPVSEDDPSAVFFTSGSSGTPKAVVCAHRGTVRLFDDWSFAPVGSGTIMPQSLAASWDAFGLDSWGVLLGGGTLVLLDGGTLELAGRLRELVRDEDVNTVFVPTAVFQMMVETDLDAFTGLRVVGTGGERLSPRHADLFLARHPDIPLYNMYGPVESTIAATDHLVRPVDCHGRDGVPIGRPLPDTGVHVLDGTRVCEVAEVGEICLSGSGLAIGYLNDPELTEHRFVDHPIGGAPTRVYRTGDAGHWSAEGLLYFDGRLDRQVKVRGHRIEPEEIERAAQEVAGVGSAAVVPVGDADGTCEELCLFYVSMSPKSGVTPADVRAELERRLPGYLVPGYVHQIDRLPVLEDRKVNRRELAEMFARVRAGEVAADQPRNLTEKRVAGIFAELLGISEVPRAASFFTMGGNSLAVAGLCVRIDEEFGVSIPVTTLFEAATVADVAELLSDAE